MSKTICTCAHVFHRFARYKNSARHLPLTYPKHGQNVDSIFPESSLNVD